MQQAGRYGVLILLVIVSLTACMDDFNRDLSTVYYNPGYSVPIGPVYYTLADIMPPIALDFPVPDTSLIPDNIDIPLLVYDDSIFFINPEFGFDTVFRQPIDLQSISDVSEYVVSAMLRSNLSNNLPVNLGVQVDFVDAAGRIVTSLYPEGGVLIERPEIGEDGQIIEPRTEQIDTYLEEEQIDQLLIANFFDIRIHIDTYNQNTDILHVYSRNGMALQLGLRAEILVPLEQ